MEIPNSASELGSQWLTVTVSEEENGPDEISVRKYVMSSEEVARLRQDLQAFNAHSGQLTGNAQYAYARCGGRTEQGYLRPNFRGLKIEAAPLASFNPARN